MKRLAAADSPLSWADVATTVGAAGPELRELVKSLVKRNLVRMVDGGNPNSRLALTDEGRQEASESLGRRHDRATDGEVEMRLLVFVALESEFEILRRRWGLEHRLPDPAWTGALAPDVDVQVLPAYGAGRVRAALETLDYLHANVGELPTLVVVLGICGGFAETDDVAPGDVIVADTVADLGTKKMRSGPDGEDREFRISPFRTDDRIEKALRAGSFDRRRWSSQVGYDYDYPSGRVPTLRFGTLICADEVVSSDEWRAGLLRAWPKALGVEMEAGGVMAACQRMGVPVAVVRGVSDLANPLKADDEWRGRSLKAAALALEEAISVLVTRR